jgi:photosystem II stability/assembly factor-like uncharacterized protein
MPRMRSLLVLLAATTVFAQVTRQTQSSNTPENLRGVSVVSNQIAWGSGAHGVYLRTTDGGRTWLAAQVPDAANLDFRGVVAFSADEAFLMSSGSGDQSRIYHTLDAGQRWQLQLTAANPKSFFDSIAFWDRTHGIVLGDPIPDEKGQLKFQLLLTSDGQSWTPVPPAQLPSALEGEGAFAASNTSLAILPQNESVVPSENSNRIVVPSQTRDPGFSDRALAPDPNIWFATGGRAARVFHSPDRGQTWQVFPTPIIHGPDSTGIFSIAFRDPLHGVIAGGDYKHPDHDGPNLAFTNDGGQAWTLSPIFPQSYFSAVAYDRRNGRRNDRRNNQRSDGKIDPKSNARPDPSLDDNRANVRLFLVSPKFIFDLRPPRNPTRISPPKKSGIQFNALSPFPNGGALFVGPKGSIVTIP